MVLSDNAFRGRKLKIETVFVKTEAISWKKVLLKMLPKMLHETPVPEYLF